MEFYVVVLVLSVTSFTADMILRYMEKIRSFGMEERLHNIKGNTIPIEDFIPHNITMLTVFGMSLGVFGIFMKLLDINAFVSFPCSLAFACIVNFTVMHFLKPFVASVTGDELSDDTDLSGMDAVCTQRIPGDDYGRIRVEYNGKHYEFDAISENETDIEKDDPVLILYREDNMCVVEKQSEVLDIINES